MRQLFVKTEALHYDWANRETRDTIDIQPISQEDWNSLRNFKLSVDDVGGMAGDPYRISLVDDEGISIASFDTTAE